MKEVVACSGLNRRFVEAVRSKLRMTPRGVPGEAAEG